MLKYFLAGVVSALFLVTSLSEAKQNKPVLHKKHKVQATHLKTSASTLKVRTKQTKKRSRSIVLAKNSHKKNISKHITKPSRYQAVASPTPSRQLSVGDLSGLKAAHDPLNLQSNVALIVDQASSEVLFEKNPDVSLPIASITKLMTSLVVLEAQQDMNEVLEVTEADIDREKGTGSRLSIGSRLTRSDMLHIALMSSENRAASSLGRYYPGGLKACVAAMNAKAKALGMHDTHYVDTTGLSSKNVASARDLVKLVKVAYKEPIIRQYSTDTDYAVLAQGKPLQYISSNRLIKQSDWDIGLQKTGYIAEAGRCLVMQAMIKGRAVVMVFLDSKGKYSRFADASRVRQWLEAARLLQLF